MGKGWIEMIGIKESDCLVFVFINLHPSSSISMISWQSANKRLRCMPPPTVLECAINHGLPSSVLLTPHLFLHFVHTNRCHFQPSTLSSPLLPTLKASAPYIPLGTSWVMVNYQPGAKTSSLMHGEVYA